MRKVFYNGNIITMDPGLPVARTIVTEGEMISLVLADSLKGFGRHGDEVRYDLGGRTVLPGMIDAHTHFFAYAMGKEWIDLRGSSSFRDIYETIDKERDRGKRKGWILGSGWDENTMDDPSLPSIETLDSVSGGIPIFLERVCGHSAIVNSPALSLAGIGKGSPDPDGGIIERDASGDPTGLLIDEAVKSVRRHIPEPSKERKRELVKEAAEDCIRVGLTGVHEMGVSKEAFSMYREMADNGSMPLRITGYLPSSREGVDGAIEYIRGFKGEGGRLALAGIKFFSDGSLGSRSAAMLDDYYDDPGNRGLMVEDPEFLRRSIMACHKNGVQAAVHTIGDRSARMVLEIFEMIQGELGLYDSRHRIEHAQVVEKEDIARFCRLGLIPSMQFVHCPSDHTWIVDRIGEKKAENAYAWRSFLSAGCIIAGGSDMPVEPFDPFLGIHAAVMRMNVEGQPSGGWNPTQRLNLEEAIQAFTVNASYAAFSEKLTGSLRKGKAADFIVISDDITGIPSSDITSIRVIASIVGAEVVYSIEGSLY